MLGFNEPNKSDQANMSVADAIAQWPEITSDPNIRVGSPAVSDDGRAWLEDFMDQVEANNLRVDFIACIGTDGTQARAPRAIYKVPSIGRLNGAARFGSPSSVAWARAIRTNRP